MMRAAGGAEQRDCKLQISGPKWSGTTCAWRAKPCSFLFPLVCFASFLRAYSRLEQCSSNQCSEVATIDGPRDCCQVCMRRVGHSAALAVGCRPLSGVAILMLRQRLPNAGPPLLGDGLTPRPPDPQSQAANFRVAPRHANRSS